MSQEKQEVHRDTRSRRIDGFCDPQFSSVLQEFERNFAERGEVGAAVSVTIEGETVVDLWGGMAEPEQNRPWTRETIAMVFSCTKGATALCAHVLASRGQLDLDAPVANYWPEFARAGKENTTVRMMLDHSSAVPVLREPLKEGGLYDWDYMVERLAAEEAHWEPGTKHGYHGLTFGWTVGEIVRRVSGRSLGQFFQEEIAKPLGLDFWIGLPEQEEPRVAPMILYRPARGEQLPRFMEFGMQHRDTIPGSFLFNSGDFLGGACNTREARAAEIGGANGVTDARGLAGMYAPLACGGSLNGVTLVDPDTLARMAQVSSASHEDAALLAPTRFSLGFMVSMDNRRFGTLPMSAILGPNAFGHVGAGGSIGFADPTERMSFGYMMNRMGNGLLLNDRGQSLVDAVYRTLGYRSDASGVWVR